MASGATHNDGLLAGAIDAEQALLGAVLLNNDALRLVEGIVRADDFSEPLHRHLWQLMLDAERAGKRVDPKLLATYIGPDAAIPLDHAAGKVTVKQYIARLAAEATTIIDAPHYAAAVRGIADQNRMAEIGAALLHEIPVKVDAVASDAIDKLDALLSERSRSATPGVTFRQALTSAIDATAIAYQLDGRPTGIPYGLADLDRLTSGMQPAELIVMAGRPGMGKTALGLGVSRNVAEAGKSVLYYSLEMSDVALAHRVLSDVLYDQGVKLSYWALRAGKMTEREFEAMADMAKAIASLPIKIEQQPGLTMAQIAARARQHKRRHGLDLLVVDHMHLIRPSERYAGHRVEEIGEVTRGLKGLAKELSIPVLALCQLSRDVEKREDKRPNMADLRGSGDIEQDADVIIMLYREAYYLLRSKPNEANREAFAEWLTECDSSVNKLEAIIEKQRSGPTGTINLFCSIEHNAVRTMARADHLPDSSASAPAKEPDPIQEGFL